MSRGLFVIGTKTDVGKTYVSGLLVKALGSSGYFKAAMSGNTRSAEGELIPGDALEVKQVSGTFQKLSSMCPYVYEEALSPHLAARREHRPIRPELVYEALREVEACYEFVTLEGAGGLLCPLKLEEESLWQEDVISASGYPCLLVADAGLGTINAVGLTLFYMKERGIRLKAVLLNRFKPGNPMHEDNKRVIEELSALPVYGVEDGADKLPISAEIIRDFYEEKQ